MPRKQKFKTKNDRVTGFFDPVKDAVGNVLSAPARRRAKRQMKRDSANVEALKKGRDLRNVPIEPDPNDPLFRAKMNAINAETSIRQDAAKRAKKARRKSR